jgi:hypothetical protein
MTRIYKIQNGDNQLFDPCKSVLSVARFGFLGKAEDFRSLPLLHYRSFHALNHSFHVAWLFPFQHTKFSAARGAGRHKIQFFMRRQHQMVAFAAPGHMVAKSASVGHFAIFPLDRDVFIESGHSLLPGKAFYSSRPSIKRKQGRTASKLSRVTILVSSGSPLFLRVKAVLPDNLAPAAALLYINSSPS